MVRNNYSDSSQFSITKHWLKRIYIIEGLVASILALGCVWVFAQVIVT